MTRTRFGQQPQDDDGVPDQQQFYHYGALGVVSHQFKNHQGQFESVHLTRDVYGRVTTRTQYHPDGGQGLSRVYDYSPFGQRITATLHSPDGSVLSRVDYDFQASGNLRRMTVLGIVSY